MNSMMNPNPKPMTNGDRIRAMSDDELAEKLVFGIKIGDENMYFDISLKTICNSRILAEECCLDWLKQPAETGYSEKLEEQP